jgi:hypothetical protein
MPQAKSSKYGDEPHVILRTYPKVIFLFPTLAASLVFLIIQAFYDEPIRVLGQIWMFVFFCNLFVLSFETNSVEFIALVVAVVGGILLAIYFIAPRLDEGTGEEIREFFNFGLTTVFYGTISVVMAGLLIGVWFDRYFDYWKVEKNEILHKSGLLANVKRFPTSNLRYNKEINCVFAFLVGRSGTITLIIDNNNVVTLENVLDVNRKAQALDEMLSQIRVKVVNE